jgi:hypothetical protein
MCIVVKGPYSIEFEEAKVSIEKQKASYPRMDNAG